MTETIRMRWPGGGGLDGYIFKDMKSARNWLSQPFFDGMPLKLEVVEAADCVQCPRCGGAGKVRPIKGLRPITLAEVLAGG
jgi:hypothetical protein